MTASALPPTSVTTIGKPDAIPSSTALEKPSLPRRSEDSEVRRLEQKRNIRSFSEEANSLAEPRSVDGPSYFRSAAIVAAGAKQNPALGQMTGNSSERCNQIEMALIGKEIGHNRGDEALLFETQRCAGLLARDILVPQAHAVIDQANPVFRTAFFCDQFPYHRTRVTQH